jgi:predicted dehydrogenase
MSEIRLAVCHPDEAALAGIAARLRGATVELCHPRAFFHSPPKNCNACVFFGIDEIDGTHLICDTHVFLVPPPFPSLVTIEHLAEGARKSGVQFAVVNPDRYLPSRQLIRKQLAALGEAGLVRLHRWEPNANTASEPNALPDALLRDLDTTLWLVGRKPNRVYAIEPKSDVGRIVQVHLGFANGAMALLDYTNTLPAGDGYQSLSVIAANGAAYADDHQNRQLLYRGGAPQAIQTGEEAGHLAAIAQDFVNALREDRDLSVHANAWKDVFAVADTVSKSLASGRAEVVS